MNSTKRTRNEQGRSKARCWPQSTRRQARDLHLPREAGNARDHPNDEGRGREHRRPIGQGVLHLETAALAEVGIVRYLRSREVNDGISMQAVILRGGRLFFARFCGIVAQNSACRKKITAEEKP